MAIAIDKLGGRTVHLFIPFEYNGKRVDTITFAAFKFGHLLLWQERHWPNMIALMTELAGVDEAVLRELRYPDADRVMEAFMANIPQEVRDDIGGGMVPLMSRKEEPEEAEAPHEPGDEDERLQGPGAPLPDAGFDLSDDGEPDAP
jgi:hypothetical protein